MENINHFACTGNLVRDAEVKAVGASFVMSFTVACNKSKKVGDQWKEVPSYFDVSYWTKGAEKLKGYLVKGTPVAVQGYLEQQSWEKEGKKQSRIVVQAEKVQWFSKGGNGAPAAVQALAKEVGGTAYPSDSDFPEDVPW